MTALVNVIVMLGMLVIVPLGLRNRGQDLRSSSGPGAGALSLWLPRGVAATTQIPTGSTERLNRGLLAVSAAVLVATMLLALSWAVGEATELPHPSLAWMAATHGLGNALGFALCSVPAWQRPARTPGTGGSTSTTARSA